MSKEVIDKVLELTYIVIAVLYLDSLRKSVDFFCLWCGWHKVSELTVSELIDWPKLECLMIPS